MRRIIFIIENFDAGNPHDPNTRLLFHRLAKETHREYEKKTKDMTKNVKVGGFLQQKFHGLQNFDPKIIGLSFMKQASSYNSNEYIENLTVMYNFRNFNKNKGVRGLNIRIYSNIVSHILQKSSCIRFSWSCMSEFHK